ncbi:MAG: alpha/beta hydrolase [Magnetovibrio sp.]|nr:alpha/beta hydrolase [Magnetovibrio sp.]
MVVLRKKFNTAFVLSLIYLTACSPKYLEPTDTIQMPELLDSNFRASDGTVLPMRIWNPPGKKKAVLIALHGFNDYSNFFDAPGNFLKTKGVLSYAYDQRGFAFTKTRGFWPGTSSYVNDFTEFVQLVKKRHGDLPLFVIGESMGGAITLLAMTRSNAPSVDGVILSAPAVWGRVSMPWYQRAALWLGVRLAPGMRLTGRGLKLTPSDNTEMLVALGRDPKVIKETRIDTIHGLVDLMDDALAVSAKFTKRALILYGKRDEIVPVAPTHFMISKLPPSEKNKQWVALYESGYHMLLRDLQAEIIWEDIAHWMQRPGEPLPSGAEKKGTALRLKLKNRDKVTY